MSAMTAFRMMLCALVLALFGHATRAYAEPVVVPLRAAILLRSLGYERGVAEGKGELVLVVISGSDAASKTDAREMQKAFEELAGRLRIAGRAVKVRALQHTQVTATVSQLKSLGPTAVYFAQGLETVSAELTYGTTPAFVPMCADGAVLGAGCALGVRAMGDASQLVIDMKRAERAKLSFDPRMLRLAHVIR